MIVTGYLLAIAGLYALYTGSILVGATALFIGGLMSGGFSIGLSAIATLSLISAIAYGIHQEFTPTIIMLSLLAAVLSAVSRRGGKWELGLDLFDRSDGWGSDSCGGD